MKKTLVDLFEGSVANYPNNTFLKEKIGKEWTDTTYAQVREKVYELGAGFVKLGVAPKDNMALLSEGRNMWIISECFKRKMRSLLSSSLIDRGTLAAPA